MTLARLSSRTARRLMLCILVPQMHSLTNWKKPVRRRDLVRHLKSSELIKIAKVMRIISMKKPRCILLLRLMRLCIIKLALFATRPNPSHRFHASASDSFALCISFVQTKANSLVRVEIMRFHSTTLVANTLVTNRVAHHYRSQRINSTNKN